MASKPIRRSVTGLTNKTTSNPQLHQTPTTTNSGHPKQCVCKTCTCGRHRCTGRDHSNVTSVGGHAPFEGSTENKSEFKAHTLPPRPPPKERAKPPASLPLEGMTESKAQYKQHELPEKHPKHVEKYVPNPNPLDGISEHHDRFKVWPWQGVPKKFTTTVWTPNPEKFDGTTTNKSDFKGVQVAPVKAIKKAQEYIPPDSKFDGKSLYASDFKQPEKIDLYHVPPPPAYQMIKEDRDFNSVAKQSYVQHPRSAIRPPTKVKQEYVPNPNKFIADSTNRTDFHQFARAELDKHRTIPVRTAAGDRQGTHAFSTASDHLASQTEYKTMYLSKPIPPRPTGHVYTNASHYTIGVTNVFEGVSTQKADYRGSYDPSARGVAFKPKLVSEHAPEDRDFLSETKSRHDRKSLIQCLVLQQQNSVKTRAQDGHLYFEDGQQKASSQMA